MGCRRQARDHHAPPDTQNPLWAHFPGPPRPAASFPQNIPLPGSSSPRGGRGRSLLFQQGDLLGPPCLALPCPHHAPDPLHDPPSPTTSHALQAVLVAALQPSPGLAVGAAANSLVYLLGIQVLLRGLTWEGVVSSWFLGTLSYAAFGPGAYAIVCLYFVVGSLVTKLKLEQKQREGIAEARSGRRSLGSVLGSGFAGMVCAALALGTGSVDLWRVGFVASFASKLADTVSSEVGKVGCQMQGPQGAFALWRLLGCEACCASQGGGGKQR